PLENFIENLDPETAMDKFLTHIAFTLANPTDILNDPTSYRKRLLQAITLYKINGTTKSYQLFFALLGYSINLIEHFPRDHRYDLDPPLEYDDISEEGDLGLYDLDKCNIGC